MSVTIPSDLVVDVMRNADADRMRLAVSKLGGSDNRVATADFDKLAAGLREFGSTTPVIPGIQAAGVGDEVGRSRAVPALSASPGEVRRVSARPASPYVAFEQMLLRNMLESTLPGAQSGVFGGDFSGDVWRSMAADQLSGVYARSGGIGIARMLARAEGPATIDRHEQWPYFGVRQIQAFQTDAPKQS